MTTLQNGNVEIVVKALAKSIENLRPLSPNPKNTVRISNHTNTLFENRFFLWFFSYATLSQLSFL